MGWPLCCLNPLAAAVECSWQGRCVASLRRNSGPSPRPPARPPGPCSFCHRKLRDFQAGAAVYGRLLDLGHRSVRTYNARAYCFASLGRYAAAVADYDQAIALDPSNAHAYHNRWVRGLALGRWASGGALGPAGVPCLRCL